MYRGDSLLPGESPPVPGAFLVAVLHALAAAVLALRGVAETADLSFRPGHDGLAPDAVRSAVLWLHCALLASGAWALRPREGRDSFASNYLSFLAGQGLVSLLLFAAGLEIAWRGTSRISAALPFLPVLALALWALGPLVASLALLRVRRGGLLVAAQCLPPGLLLWSLVLSEAQA